MRPGDLHQETMLQPKQSVIASAVPSQHWQTNSAASHLRERHNITYTKLCLQRLCCTGLVWFSVHCRNRQEDCINALMFACRILSKGNHTMEFALINISVYCTVCTGDLAVRCMPVMNFAVTLWVSAATHHASKALSTVSCDHRVSCHLSVSWTDLCVACHCLQHTLHHLHFP